MEAFEFEVDSGGAVASIDLSRPSEGNKLTRPMIRRLGERIAELAAIEETRVIVVKARGEAFCAGRDTRGDDRSGMSPYQIRGTMGVILGLYDAIGAAPVPVVARVQGRAIGFGAALAAGCDITLASDAATFGFSEIKHGVPPTLAMAAVLRKVAPKALTYLIYSGDEIGAAEAVTFGLASRAIPDAEFDREATRFIEELAGRPRLVLETVKKYQRHATGLPPETASEYAGTLLALVRSSK